MQNRPAPRDARNSVLPSELGVFHVQDLASGCNAPQLTDESVGGLLVKAHGGKDSRLETAHRMAAREQVVPDLALIDYHPVCYRQFHYVVALLRDSSQLDTEAPPRVRSVASVAHS